jgi:hypothetical protein
MKHLLKFEKRINYSSNNTNSNDKSNLKAQKELKLLDGKYDKVSYGKGG